MSIFQALQLSTSGLTAERLRMDVITANMANMNATRTETGDPYRRQVAVFQEVLTQDKGKKKLGGIQAVAIEDDMSEFEYVYNPNHPDADEKGYVRMPNVDPLVETLDMMAASRAYEANVTAFNAAKAMYVKALEIGK